MHRRTFIEMAAVSVLGAASYAHAQQSAKVRRLGILTAGTLGNDWAVFFETLRERGWIEQEKMCASVDLVNTYMGLPRKVECSAVFTNDFLTKVAVPIAK